MKEDLGKDGHGRWFRIQIAMGKWMLRSGNVSRCWSAPRPFAVVGVVTSPRLERGTYTVFAFSGVLVGAVRYFVEEQRVGIHGLCHRILDERLHCSEFTEAARPMIQAYTHERREESGM